MATEQKPVITIEATVNAPVEKVWKYWGEPQHITKWAFASDDWHAPSAENDLRTDGKFSTTMAAKDGSVSFEFGGVYSKVVPHKVIEYTMGDGRKVSTKFAGDGNQTTISQSFEAEGENSLELQKAGWQAILNNMKKYTEGN